MNIVRLYNQNRKIFWVAIIIIAFALIAIQIVDAYIGNKFDKMSQENNTNIVNNNNTTVNKYSSNKSGVTGGTVETEKLDNAEDLLDEFFKYCNKKDLEKAYNMLTDECKEKIYPNLELFEANYYNNMFQDNQNTYSFENWNKDTYLVKIYKDPLVTGRMVNESNKKIDYVTIVNEKLNISSYIGRTTINKEQTTKDITIKVNSKDTFIDYETYNITVTNNSSSTICMGLVDDSKNIYLKDSNNVKYGFYNHEITQEELVIRPGYTFDISLKFYSSYVSTKKIEYIVFNKVYLDYQNDENNITSISVEV